jgi:hypothetical protein
MFVRSAGRARNQSRVAAHARRWRLPGFGVGDLGYRGERLTKAGERLGITVKTWIEAQKAALKTGRLDAVLQALAAHCEAPEVEDGHAPVRGAIAI